MTPLRQRSSQSLQQLINICAGMLRLAAYAMLLVLGVGILSLGTTTPKIPHTVVTLGLLHAEARLFLLIWSLVFVLMVIMAMLTDGKLGGFRNCFAESAPADRSRGHISRL